MCVSGEGPVHFPPVLAFPQPEAVVDEGRAVERPFIVSPNGRYAVFALVGDGVHHKFGALQIFLKVAVQVEDGRVEEWGGGGRGKGGREGGGEGGRGRNW
jgi:hypothetical protein